MPLTLATPTYRATRRAAATRVYRDAFLPAATAGLDYTNPLTDMDPRTAVLLDNVFCRRYGNELRHGSTQWVNNIGGASAPQQVLSVMAYRPAHGLGITFSPKLFAAATDGKVYDVTDQAGFEAYEPPVAVNLPNQVEPGVLSWTNFATGDTNYLITCSAGAGYWTYDTVGGWVNRTGNITGPGTGRAINWDFVLPWKNRLWFIESNTGKAWYLDTNAIQGAATFFDFGPLLVHGGDLEAIASWTVDGGEGIDDKLVVFGQGGDVLIYEGTDPSSASTFRIVGRWFAGRPPAGRRFASRYSGDLAFITEEGVEYMSRVMQGRGELDPESHPRDPARQFNEVIGRDVRATRGQMFWQFIALPSEESAILTTPHVQGPGAYQYAFSVLPQAWSRMVGMQMACAEEFGGDLFFGTLDGRVVKAFVGTTDDAWVDGSGGRDVFANIQTAYVAPNNDRMSLKRPQLVCPIFEADSPPSVKLQINTEWTTKGVPGSAPYTPDLTAKWDQAHWDHAVWGGERNTYQAWVGVEGLGSFMSLRMAFTGPPGTVFTGYKILYEPGGVM